MRVSNEQYAMTLAGLMEGEPKKAAEHLVAFLRRRGELHRLPAILAALERQDEIASGRLSLEAVTAREAGADLQKALRKKAAVLFPGQKISLTFQADPALIGGFRLRGQEAEYDASVRAAIKSLRHALNTSINS